MWTSLTNHEAQQFVRQDAGGDESHPQADVKFLGALWLHPHEQTETQTAGGGQNTHQYISYVHFLHTWLWDLNKTTHFFIFSKTSAIFPKRFWKRFKSLIKEFVLFRAAVGLLDEPRYTCAFCATSSTSWNFSDTVKSSFGGSFNNTHTQTKATHWSPVMDTFHSDLHNNSRKASYHGFRDLRHNAPLDPPTSEK